MCLLLPTFSSFTKKYQTCFNISYGMQGDILKILLVIGNSIYIHTYIFKLILSMTFVLIFFFYIKAKMKLKSLSQISR